MKQKLRALIIEDSDTDAELLLLELKRAGYQTEHARVQTAAELWHFLGRQGVAVAYTWPAGGEGVLRGYNSDYNSSEFTVYHLKQTLRAIAGCPDVKKIHIIAHSRGTDVTVNALRELLDSVNPPGLDQLEPLPIVPPHERLAHEQG